MIATLLEFKWYRGQKIPKKYSQHWVCSCGTVRCNMQKMRCPKYSKDTFSTVHPLKEFERCRRSGQQTLRHPIFANCTVGTVPPTMWATFWIPKENLGQTVLLLLPCKIHTVSLFIWALAFMATSVSGRGDFEGAAFLRPPHDRQGRGIVEPCWG